jgi:hypothetical protein
LISRSILERMLGLLVFKHLRTGGEVMGVDVASFSGLDRPARRIVAY